MINALNTTAKHLSEDCKNGRGKRVSHLIKQEKLFFCKIKKVVHPSILFDGKRAQYASLQKQFDFILDTSFAFYEHIKAIKSKVSKTIGPLRKLNSRLPRFSFTTIYKPFVRSHLDYGDVIFEKAYNNSFHKTLESPQCKASWAIIFTIKGSSLEKLYQNMGLGSLQNRRSF